MPPKKSAKRPLKTQTLASVEVSDMVIPATLVVAGLAVAAAFGLQLASSASRVFGGI